LDFAEECTISGEVDSTANAASKDPNQVGDTSKNRFKAGPKEWQINWGYCQRHPHQQSNSPTWNKSALNRWQGRQGTINWL